MIHAKQREYLEILNVRIVSHYLQLRSNSFYNSFIIKLYPLFSWNFFLLNSQSMKIFQNETVELKTTSQKDKYSLLFFSLIIE